MGWLMVGFAAGCTNVVMWGRGGRRSLGGWEGVRAGGASGVWIWFAAPAMLRMLLAEPDAGQEAFKSLRKVTYGGSVIAPSLLRLCMEQLGCELAQMYA